MDGKGGKIYKEYKYDYVTKLVTTSNEGNKTYHGIKKCNPTEMSILINLKKYEIMRKRHAYS